mgnify:FL=1
MKLRLLVISALCAGAVFGTCAEEPVNGYEKKIVMEELTGTWCGYCPRGIATMEYLHETYGDRFIGISLHGAGTGVEPMIIPGNEYLNSLMSASGASGFPSGIVNRQSCMDPYDAVAYIASHASDRSYQKIDIDEVLYDEPSGEVGVRCAVTNCISVKRLGLSIAIVCIENDVQQEDNPFYAQLTYFHKKYGAFKPKELEEAYPEIYPYLEPYVTGEVEDRFSAGKYTFYVPASVMKYQEVARGIFPDYDGMKCDRDFPANEPQHFTINFTMPEEVLNWKNTEMVALLINSKGEIVNADIFSADGYQMSGLSDVLAEEDADAPEEYYTLQGIRTERPSNGLYIKKKGKKTVKEFFH